MPFTYHMPTKVVVGRGCLRSRAELLKELGAKALLVAGSSSARANGSLDDAERALAANGQSFVLYDRIPSNPDLDCVLRGTALARDCDFVLAIGGGSALDAGKAVALLAAHPEPLDAARIFTTAYTRCLPVAAVPTTAGSGSEVTPYAILTDRSLENKKNLGSPLIFPRLAFLDGAYTRDLPRDLTVNTAVDALCHAVEGMLTLRASPLSDALALSAINLIMECRAALERGAPDLAGRDRLLLASSLAGMVVANTGTTAVHALGYPLTYHKGLAHGRANGLILGQFMRRAGPIMPETTGRVLAAMGFADAAALEDWLSALLRGREELTPAEARHFAAKAAKAKNIANCRYSPGEDDLYAMLRDAPLITVRA